MAKGHMVTMQEGDKAGDVFHLQPARIHAKAYMEGIQWGTIGTPEEAVAKAEIARMLQVYERFCAFHQPLKFRSGKIIWEVRFPPGTKWADGPQRPSAQAALLDNYQKNKRFPGYGVQGLATDDGLRSLDRVISDSLKQDKERADQSRIILKGEQ